MPRGIQIQRLCLLMLFQQIGRISSFMHFLLSDWLGDASRKYRQTKAREFCWCHCGHVKVGNQNYWDCWRLSSNQSYSTGGTCTITRNKTTTPPSGETNSIGMSLEQKLYEDRGFSKKTTDILQSWWQSSQKQYDAYIQKWVLFCAERKIDPIHPNVSDALEFLAGMNDQNLSYSSINTLCSALSAILQLPGPVNSSFSEHLYAKCFMKGIFQNRPPKPWYNKTWNVNIVLQYLHNMKDSKDLSIKDLTFKLVMLIVLTTASRGQSLHLLDLQGMVKEDNCFTFYNWQ